jgi:hypothetical protein
MPVDDTLGFITPEKAVSRAFWMVNGPVMLVMFGPASVLYGLGYLLGSSTEVGAALSLAAIAAFFVCWPLAWLTWSILTPRWRLWAYQHVDDIGELKRLAVADHVIWPEGHLFQRTEIMSPNLKAALHAIEATKQS